jgi:hypothetical protein
MSYLLIEGFEIYPNINGSADGLQGRWLSTGGYGNYNTGSGRFGGQCIQAQGSSNFNGAVQFALTPVGSGTSTFCIGLAYYMAAVTPPNIIMFSLLNGGANSSPSAGILGIGINPSQQPYIYVGSYEKSYNNLQPNLPIAGATSATAMPSGSWHYFELVGTINSTTGSLIMYQDGVQVASVTGNTGVQTADTLNLGATNYYVPPGWFDDIYVTNTAVRVGERRIQTLAVNADNSVTWASNASSNYSQINSVPVQASPSTNVNTQTIGATDLYNVNHLTGVPTAISAVQLHIVGSKQDVGTRIVAPVIKSGSTEVVGANAALTNSYQHYVSVYNVDPNTGSAWTANSVNAVVIGQQLVA